MRAYGRIAKEVRPVRDLRWVFVHIVPHSDAALARMREIGTAPAAQIHPRRAAITSAAVGATSAPHIHSRALIMD